MYCCYSMDIARLSIKHEPVFSQLTPLLEWRSHGITKAESYILYAVCYYFYNGGNGLLFQSGFQESETYYVPSTQM